MDAPKPVPESKPDSARGLRPLVARLAIAWLAIVLALGLWQAYGAWLFGSGADHAL